MGIIMNKNKKVKKGKFKEEKFNEEVGTKEFEEEVKHVPKGKVKFPPLKNGLSSNRPH